MSESAHLCPAGFGDDEARESADVPAHDAAAISASASAAFMIQPPRRGPSTGLTRGGGCYFARAHVRSTLGARFGGGGPPDPLGGELRERPIDPRENVLPRIADQVLPLHGDRHRPCERMGPAHRLEEQAPEEEPPRREQAHADEDAEE